MGIRVIAVYVSVGRKRTRLIKIKNISISIQNINNNTQRLKITTINKVLDLSLVAKSCYISNGLLSLNFVQHTNISQVSFYRFQIQCLAGYLKSYTYECIVYMAQNHKITNYYRYCSDVNIILLQVCYFNKTYKLKSFFIQYNTVIIVPKRRMF